MAFTISLSVCIGPYGFSLDAIINEISHRFHIPHPNLGVRF